MGLATALRSTACAIATYNFVHPTSLMTKTETSLSLV